MSRPVFDYDVAQMTNVQQNLGAWNWLRRHGPTVRQFAALSAFLSALGGCAPQPGPASNAANAAAAGNAASEAKLYLDLSQPFLDRARDLVARMTRDEKISQMMDRAPAIERLGVPAYGWWNEALHGVARAGIATVFPQAIALAASFDEPLVQQIAGVIADEARAKHHEFLRQGERERYQGLTFFSPNINIFRDPRWGRGHETYGEDPHLTGRLGVAFIRGLQGDDPKYYKTLATAKHFAVHSGPESERHRFDARVSPHDLYDTYLPQFEMAVKEAKVGSVMAAYNAVDGKAAAANPDLLGKILRNQWGFAGYVVTDCYAIKDIYKDHGHAKDAAAASALAIQAGTDLECGSEFSSLTGALERKLLPEAALDQALVRLFFARFALGMFDPVEQVPFAQIPYSKNDAPEHRALARRAAQESLVLLENRGVLPIAPQVKKLALIGPTANDVEVLLGNYHGTPSAQVTIQDGLERACKQRGVEFRSTLGSNVEERSEQELSQAEALAGWADLVVLVLGITPKQEGEEGESRGHAQGDRLDIALPAVQQELFARVQRSKKPIAVVLTGGSAQALGTIGTRAAAVLVSWYSGEEGGTAVADVLFGEQNPAGRLPVTFYASNADLPPFTDYAMDRRTYRYFRGEPSWGFGYGQSYTTFRYQKLELSTAQLDAGAALTVQVDVENVGARAGDEVVQVYVTDEKASVPVPIRSLVAFQRIHLERGQRRTLKFELAARALSIVLGDGSRVLEPGRFQIAVGGRQPGAGSRFESDQYGLQSAFEVGGAILRLPN